jgi:hypothetical protein
MRLRALAGAVLMAASLRAGGAEAQIYRLRADAYYAAADPAVGLVVLTSEARAPSWLDAESVVWIGAGGQRNGDVLIASVRARDPGGRGQLRAGRLLVSTGAIRLVHLDGVDATARAPWGTSLEVFGGVPVAAGYEPRDFDWAAGGRVAQRIGSEASVGVSYLQQRSAGAVAYEELGFDAAAAPLRWLDGALRGAADLARPGLSDLRAALALRPLAALRFELFASRRAPSHLLPATSLFAALGDIPSDRLGGSVFWRAAPRLDVLGEGGVESLGGEPGGDLRLRTTLRLDDRGDRALALEVRRQGAPGASWTGVRATARLPLTRLLAAATELEIAVPDDPRGRGAVWPWGLFALRLSPEPRWELSGAVEASASPTSVGALSAMFRVSRLWSVR